MPTITINRKVFERLVGKKLPEERLKDRISYLGTGLEKITPEEITIEIFPNRPDLLSEQGFARAFSAFIGVKTGLRKYEAKKSEHKVIVEESVRKYRPYTACAIVKGMRFDDEKIREIIQIQEKLHVTYGRNRKKAAIGIYPFEKIKTPIRFLALKPEEIKFRPLGFPRQITGAQILSQHPTGRDYGHLLEGKDKYPIFIDANNKILSMPPIINSHDVGKISEETKEVFIECSGFDYGILSKCLNMIVTALADMGGEIYQMEIGMYGEKLLSPDLSANEMKLDLKYVNRILGLQIKEKEAKELLQRMGYGYSAGKVQIPAYRVDIMHQIDLAEDMAIAYGFEKIPERMPSVATIGEEDGMDIFKRKIREILIGLGMIECSSYHLTNKENQTKKMRHEAETVELANALNQEYNVLTSWITPQAVEIFSNNKHNETPQNIFLINGVFKKDKTQETGVLEQERMCCALCSDNADYTRIKQILDYLMRMVGIDYRIEATSHNSFVPGRVGRVLCKGKKTAIIGEIHPQVLENWGLEMPVAVFEINLTELYEMIRD